MTVLTDAQGIAGIASSLMGAVQSFRGSAQQFQVARDLIKDTEEEMAEVMRDRDAIARNARQRAYAAQQDIAFLNAQTEGQQDALREQGRALESRVIAGAAGSGVELTGSPLLVAADVALQTERAIQNQNITRNIGTRKFRFEVERELQDTADIQAGTPALLSGISRYRQSQAAGLTESATFARLRGITNLTSAFANKGTQELYNSLFPKATT